MRWIIIRNTRQLCGVRCMCGDAGVSIDSTDDARPVLFADPRKLGELGPPHAKIILRVERDVVGAVARRCQNS